VIRDQIIDIIKIILEIIVCLQEEKINRTIKIVFTRMWFFLQSDRYMKPVKGDI
jgi:hypothetical protein